MPKEMYLAYIVFNVRDGNDLETIGVYPTVEGALSALKDSVIDEFNFIIDDELFAKAVEDKYLFIEDDLKDSRYGVEKVTAYVWRWGAN